MARPRTSPSGDKRTKISVTLDPELLERLAPRVGPDKEFSSVSHALNRALARLLDEGAPGPKQRGSYAQK